MLQGMGYHPCLILVVSLSPILGPEVHLLIKQKYTVKCMKQRADKCLIRHKIRKCISNVFSILRICNNNNIAYFCDLSIQPFSRHFSVS